MLLYDVAAGFIAFVWLTSSNAKFNFAFELFSGSVGINK
jgi:hypothetical protein